MLVARFALALITGLFVGCTPKQPAKAPDASPPDATVDGGRDVSSGPRASGATRPDWAAIRAVEAQCADCHPEVVEAWRRSPMGHSLGPVTGAVADAVGSGAVVHPATGERFTVKAGRVFAEVADPGAGVRGVEVEATHVIGSGAHTRSFARFADGALSMMPLTWYRSTGRWDLSPGYAVADHPAFYRQARAECVTCHGDPAATKPDTDARFEAAPTAIGCSRCHGDARAHVEARLAGRAAAPVVPTRLEPARAADVCGQCHLQGAVRVLRDGRRWDDMMPGMALGEVVAVFVHELAGRDYGIASHAERLGRSACAQAAPAAQMCTTCHAPHPTRAEPDRSAACRACHAEGAGGAHACAGPGGDDCAACHMARRPTSDIPHVAVTDHYIRVRPEAEARADADTGPLRWINRPPGVDDAEADLLLGRAYAEHARAALDSAARTRAATLLTAALAKRPADAAGWADLASMRRLGGDLPGARAALEEAVTRAPRAQWWADLARLRLAMADVGGARAAIDEASARRPGDADDMIVRAQLALATGAPFEALVAAFTAARPDQGDGEVLRAAASRPVDAAAAEAAYAAAVAHEPGDVASWLELCRVRADRADWAGAEAACAAGARHARGAAAQTRFAGARARLALGRGDRQQAAELAGAAMQSAPADAAFVLGRLALDAGRRDDAMALLDRAIGLDPTLGAAWAALAEVLRARGESALAARAARQARRLGAPAAPAADGGRAE